MQPYVIKQGEYLAALAAKLGFDADTVWNDDKNADLRKLRPDPNIPWPSDILYVPDSGDQDVSAHIVNPGTSNFFVSSAPTVPITLKFLDAEYASKACTVDELPQLAGLSTDAGGSLSFAAPVSLSVATITFEDPPCKCYCKIGNIDPLTTLSGVFQRLQNLMYFADGETSDASGDLATVRGALRAFKAFGADPESQYKPQADSGLDEGQEQPVSAQAPSASTGGDAAVYPGPPDSTGRPDPEAATGVAARSADDTDEATAPDDAGLRDDGTMEDDVSQLLLTAHSC